MRVDELRGIIRQCDRDKTTKLAVALYKLIPKQVREDRGLDDFIRTLPGTDTPLRNIKPANTDSVNFDVVRRDAEAFVEHAAAGYYFQPNRVIAKAARSKWRFTARRLIKLLIAARGEDAAEAALLLVEIWRALCYACSRYIFPTETPFSAVGYTQPDLLDIVLAKLFSAVVPQDAMRLAVWAVLESQVDRETLSSELQRVLLSQLGTIDMKQLARDECAFFAEHFKDTTACPYTSTYFRPTFPQSWLGDSSQATDSCAELWLRISIALDEYDTGIEYFQRHIDNRHPEVALFCLLEIIAEHIDGNPHLAKVWADVYDDAVGKGISPRSQLVNQRAAFRPMIT